MTERTAVVKNADGIHLRPTSLIIQLVAEYPGDIQIESPKGHCDLRSVFELMLLALERGTVIRIRVSGPDEEDVCRKLADLFEREYDQQDSEPCAAQPGVTTMR